MREVTFVVPGPPQGKQRARSTRSGHHFTPKKTVEYERQIREAYTQANRHGYITPMPLETPVQLIVVAHYQVPESWSKKKKENCGFPTVKPDIDNVLKAVMDALNKIAWLDDKQVVSAHIHKKYGSPCLEIQITEICE